MWDIVAKKKKKQKKTKEIKSNDVMDLGGQVLFRDPDTGSIYRKPDDALMIMGLKHIQKAINSMIENYYAKKSLDPKDDKNNALRFIAGQKLESLITITGKNASQTFNWQRLEGISSGVNLFNERKHDCEQELNDALKYTGQYQSLLWDVIVLNLPARHSRMNDLRNALDLLVEFFQIK